MSHRQKISKRILLHAKVLFASLRYRRTLSALRLHARQRKLRVAFLVSELAKWKGGPLLDILQCSDLFDPFVAVMPLPEEAKRHSAIEVQQIICRMLKAFENLNVPAVNIWNPQVNDTTDIQTLGADIVVYQQPWGLPPNMKPLAVSRRALTFYLPYYLPSDWDISLELDRPMHHLLFGYLVFSRSIARLYQECTRHFSGGFSTRFLPIGHPTLDSVCCAPACASNADFVIYAPHFSVEGGGIRQPCRYATFLENGVRILRYAKEHPEIKWAFKPHPALRRMLTKTGSMSTDAVNAYYTEWERIAVSCYDGPDEYLKLFAASRALITDCSSFLTEYGCTGKPIVWLKGPKSNFVPHPLVEKLYASYYAVSNEAEMLSAFESLLVRREDNRRDERLALLKQAGLLGGHAAKRFETYLRRILAR